MTKSTCPKSALIRSIVFCFTSFEKASPLMLLAYRPASSACFSKAAVLYQPAEAGFPSAGGFSKKTPMVAALLPKALVILEANPKPVDAPMINTFFGPSMKPFSLV
jgi:hypothetical protein